MQLACTVHRRHRRRPVPRWHTVLGHSGLQLRRLKLLRKRPGVCRRPMCSVSNCESHEKYKASFQNVVTVKMVESFTLLFKCSLLEVAGSPANMICVMGSAWENLVHGFLGDIVPKSFCVPSQEQPHVTLPNVVEVLHVSIGGITHSQYFLIVLPGPRHLTLCIIQTHWYHVHVVLETQVIVFVQWRPAPEIRCQKNC